MMLYVQRIDLVYTKAVRYGNFANARRAVKFLPVEFDKSELRKKTTPAEILFNKTYLSQFPDKGIITQNSKTKLFDDRAFFTGKLFNNPFGERVFVKRTESGYGILYTDKVQRGYIKSKFTLSDGQSGRIVYNERHSFWDAPTWYYYLTTFNFVCADADKFKPKIFFIKKPDFEFNDMKKLR